MDQQPIIFKEVKIGQEFEVDGFKYTFRKVKQFTQWDGICNSIGFISCNEPMVNAEIQSDVPCHVLDSND